jgi:hypothetical protein
LDFESRPKRTLKGRKTRRFNIVLTVFSKTSLIFAFKAKKNMAKPISVFLISIFIAFLATPSVVLILKNTADVSMLINIAEEEQSSERVLSENHTKILPKFQVTFLKEVDFTKVAFGGIYTKNWVPIYFDPVSPPPELS